MIGYVAACFASALFLLLAGLIAGSDAIRLLDDVALKGLFFLPFLALFVAVLALPFFVVMKLLVRKQKDVRVWVAILGGMVTGLVWGLVVASGFEIPVFILAGIVGGLVFWALEHGPWRRGETEG